MTQKISLIKKRIAALSLAIIMIASTPMTLLAADGLIINESSNHEISSPFYAYTESELIKEPQGPYLYDSPNMPHNFAMPPSSGALVLPSSFYMASCWVTLAQAVSFAVPGNTAEIFLTNNIPASGHAAIIINQGQDITLTSDEGVFTLFQNTTNQRHFIVNNGGTLRLGNVALSGGLPTITVNHGGVVVNTGGRLYMGAGSVIANNRQGDSGGGVLVSGADAVFTMSGGEIRDNISANIGGGGVRVHNGGLFNMSGGFISNNEFTGTGTANGGGGVRVQTGSTFSMNGGAITGNLSGHQGAGVAINGPNTVFNMNGGSIGWNAGRLGGGVSTYRDSLFYMTGGEIHNNTTNQLGGGVNIEFDASFVMKGDSRIHNNSVTAGSAVQGGGGVFIQNSGHFYMYDGVIEANNAVHTGGVRLLSGVFTMNGGIIRSNAATAPNGNGGGVNVRSANIAAPSTFYMNGGEIYNNIATQSGGGILIDSTGTGVSTVEINGGEIHDNIANSTAAAQGGGGIFMAGVNNVLTIADGEIYGNSAIHGGGIRVTSGSLNITGGTIDGNTATNNGGGVWLGTGTPTSGARINMTGGTISNNRADGGDGGGIFASNTSTANPVPLTAYANIIAAAGDFYDNTAGSGQFAPPSNAAEFSFGHLLTNYHINYRGTGMVGTVVFNLNGGNVGGSETNISLLLPLGSEIGEAAIPELARQHYTFNGWRYTSQASESPNLNPHNVAAHVVAGGITFTAQWVPILHEIVFELSGGNVGGDTMDISHNLHQGTVIGAGNVPTPVRQGYILSGWQSGNDNTLLDAETILEIEITGAKIFTAVWTLIPTATPPPPTSPPPADIVEDAPKPANTPVITPKPAEVISSVYMPEEDKYELRRHYSFMIGFADGTIRPQATITRAEVATMLFRLMSDENRAAYWRQDNNYTDVASARWYNNAISTTSNYGLFTGMPDDSFQPQRPITRAEFAVLMARLRGVNNNGPPLFADIHGHWAQEYINAAAQNGWVQGPYGLGGVFLPNQPITRAEAVAMISRTLTRLPCRINYLLPNMRTWPDNTNPHAWYYMYIQEATNSHYYMVNGDGLRETWVQIITPERPWHLLERPYSRPWDIFT
ncbi:MAG: S-layer homology domain-containing protein [Defluviitaleaceae bacterium]|nr:S-layer homology domain-containing protein [Defluviitaleaceae bacterium]